MLKKNKKKKSKNLTMPCCDACKNRKQVDLV